MKKLLLLLPFFCVNLHAAIININTAQGLLSATPALKAGDTMVVAAGTYNVSSWTFSGLSGSASQWILVKASGNAVISGTSTTANVVQVNNCHYLRLSGFEITASVTDGPDGLKIQGQYNSYLEFDNLYIHDMPFGGVEMFPDSSAYITIRNCEIARCAASGMYIGYPAINIIHDIRIENNYIHHCPVDPLSDLYYGIQFKGWCYRAQIVDNVLHDVSGTSRAGIIVYYGEKPQAGDDPANLNVVSGNVLWNCRNEGITAMSDALIENNIVFDAGIGINLQAYNDASYTGESYAENLTVRNNTVFRCRTACISFSGWTPTLLGHDVYIARNVFYQAAASDVAVEQSITALPGFAANYYYGINQFPPTVKGFTAGNGLPDFLFVQAGSRVPNIDFYPSQTAPFIDPPDSASWSAPVDFDSIARPFNNLSDAGAYEFTGASHSGWQIAEEQKAAFLPPFVNRGAALPATGRMTIIASPNPFHGTTSLFFRLPEESGRAAFTVYDPTGRRIFQTWVDRGVARPLSWTAKDPLGKPLPAGCYMGEIRTEKGLSAMRRLFVLR